MQAVTTIGLDIAKSVSAASAVLQEAAILPGWRRGLRHVTPLVASTASSRPHCAPDATGQHCRVRAFDRDLIRGGNYGQRSYEPHQ